MSNLRALILAGGGGTRMKSKKPKALQTLLGTSMLSHVYRACKQITEDIWFLTGSQSEQVQNHIKKNMGENSLEKCVFQAEQLGTGHAVLTAVEAMQKHALPIPKEGKLLIINTDTPLITAEELEVFIQNSQNLDLSFISLNLDEPGSYGRVMRSNFNENTLQIPSQEASVNTGSVACIIEAKDFYKKYPLCEIYEINTGIYLIDFSLLQDLLPKINNKNANSEYYLTDIVELAHKNNYKVDAFPASSETSTLGVNSPAELIEAEKYMQKRENEKHINNGVLLHYAESVNISPDAQIEEGVEIFGPCEIYGHCSIATGTVIESHCVLKNAKIGKDVAIHSFSHIEDSILGNNTNIGPYARLRPQTNLSDNVKIGNFVEIKKSNIGEGSKVNHLSYIGDSEMGSGVNVGAGCITCNYDGQKKHTTTIKDGAFLGSNCAFVAPVSIGENALIGAGSVITKNVENNKLAYTRSPQKSLEKQK